MSVTITNKEIYNKLLEVEAHVVMTNGKVKLNKWMSTSAMGLLFVLVGVLLTPLGAAC